MYRLGENHIRRRHRQMALLAVGVLIVIGGGIWVSRALRATTTIAPAPAAVVSTVTTPKVQTIHIEEALFTMDLPSDWKLKSHDTKAGNDIYTWSNTAGNAGVRLLTLYLDTPEPGLGVNKALSVQADDGSLTLTSDVSDNCAGFTAPGAGTPDAAMAAKWNGENFLCDLANYIRDVTGTVSPDGINKTLLTGSTTGEHSVFFTYTDDAGKPNYTIFKDALQSFRLK